MTEARVGFVVNTNSAHKTDNLPQKLHLLIVRVILYFCYLHKDVQWGHYLFKEGLIELAYKKQLLRSVTVKDSQKLLANLISTHSSTRSGSNPVGSWEEVLTLLLSDFDWDEGSSNYLFVLTSSLPAHSTKTQSVISNLRKDKKVQIIFVDINWIQGSLDVLDSDQLRASLGCDLLVVPTSYLCSDIAPLLFRQLFKAYLTGTSTGSASYKEVKFAQHSAVIVIDEDDVQDKDEMSCYIWPIQRGTEVNEIVSLSFREYVSYTIFCRFLEHNDCYIVTFDSEYYNNTDLTSSFLVESEELSSEGKHSCAYLIKHLSPSSGVMFRVVSGTNIAELCGHPRLPEEYFNFSSFFSLHPTDMEMTKFVVSLRMRDNRLDRPDEDLMEELYQFHNLNISEQGGDQPQTDIQLDQLPHIPATCAREEAMLSASPRYMQRKHVTYLVRKYQQDIKLEMESPVMLKERCKDGKENLVKEHKIQVVLHLLNYCEFSDVPDKDTTYTAILALLRSLTYLTSPTAMFNFLNNQILEEFHEDCSELLREIYEDGLMMEVPGILASDSNSLSSSILTAHAPLFCEDTTSSLSSDIPSASQSSFTRHRSWMDQSQHSQSSFSITVPKSKKKKKKQSRDSSKIAELVYVQKQSGDGQGSVKLKPNWTSQITPTESKQSSKRRKLSRKNSVLDTPLKKQVKNPTAAKTSRARQRIELTPQKSTPILHIQESPVRGRASSFFGSQAQPPTRSFVIKDGFKTPTRPIFKLPHSSTEETPALFVESPDSRSFTPPGTPKSGRQFVKRLYYSPMRTLFKSNPLDNDYIGRIKSPECFGKENEPFMPTIHSFDKLGSSPVRPISDSARSLEPIYSSEDAQMPIFPSSAAGGNQGTVNIQSSGGFLKMLEDSSMEEPAFIHRDSDNESDISSISVASSTQRSILKSPFNRRHMRRRFNVSFSLEKESSSDNESSQNKITNFLDIIDGSIKNDGFQSPDHNEQEPVSPQSPVQSQTNSMDSIDPSDQQQSTAMVSMTSPDHPQTSAMVSMTSPDQQQTSAMVSMTSPDQQQTSAMVSMTSPDQQQTSAMVSMTAPDHPQTSDMVSMTSPDQQQTSAMVSMTSPDQQQTSAIASMTSPDHTQVTVHLQSDDHSSQDELAAVSSENADSSVFYGKRKRLMSPS